MKPSPQLFCSRLVCTAVCALLLALAVPGRLNAQGRIEGQILNGTSTQPAPHVQVLALMPRGGMQQVAETQTDANGHFVISQSGIDPGTFYLVQANYQGIPYHAPAQFDSSGIAVVNMTVYDSTRGAASIRVQLLRLAVRAEGQKAAVHEEYDVENASQPPRTYASESTFRFQVPPEVGAPAVAVQGLMKMDLHQSPEKGKSPGEFSIRYPLKPGVTPIAVDYVADYSARQFDLISKASYPLDHAEMYVLPATLNVESALFKPAGVDSAGNIQKFAAESLPAGAGVEARLSGEAAAAPQSEAGPGEDAVKAVPNSMTKLGVPLLACFLLVLLWALGVRVGKEWPQWKERHTTSPAQKQLASKADALFSSLADLDDLFAAGKIEKKKYWKERLELKAKLMAILKKGSPSLLESYATRRAPR